MRAGQDGCLQCQGAGNGDLVAGIDAASMTLRPRAQRIQLAVKLDVGFDDASARVTRFEGEVFRLGGVGTPSSEGRQRVHEIASQARGTRSANVGIASVVTA
jgi:hypothetical protein